MTQEGQQLEGDSPDEQPPVTTVSVRRSGDSFFLSAKAEDDSGVQATYYRIGEEEPKVWEGEIEVSAEQLESLRFGSIDVFGNAEPERSLLTVSTPGCEVEGEGSLSTNPKAKFALEAELERGETRSEGKVSYSDRAAGLRFASTRITSVIAHDSQATIRGEGKANGKSVDFRIDVKDLSGDGRRDTFKIELSNGYTATGTLRNGDLQIECDSGDDDDSDDDDEEDDD